MSLELSEFLLNARVGQHVLDKLKEDEVYITYIKIYHSFKLQYACPLSTTQKQCVCSKA